MGVNIFSKCDMEQSKQMEFNMENAFLAIPFFYFYYFYMSRSVACFASINFFVNFFLQIPHIES